ncbi:peptide/nickel transport system substrate-binding protein [Frankia sp. EI5c]|uniref:ABC transporter substrate-binding protein n=1 Tax=Frankia sp. EI5c TaxID=683316 RepID=UPI0007C25531|nr:ABC transporter substrate-binding protein [Frankia sp. EI5c]OAA27497.1 peptide/nickel transport system substrate-binding protein [Frankia sp. EI5c]
MIRLVPPRLAAPAVAALVLGGALTACGGGSTATSAAADPGTPVSGGTLVFAQQQEPSCLDPQVLGDMHQALFANQYLDSLVHQDSTGKIHPWLASSWEISPDGTAYTFKLRTDVRFTDGTPFNAQAVKVNFDRIISGPGEGGSAAQYLIYVTDTSVVDDSTVRVTLSRPFSPFLAEIAQSFVGIQSPTALARDKDTNCKSPVGTGPFVVRSYTPGSEAVLERNADYNSAPASAEHQGPAYLSKVVWKFIPDDSARFGAVSNGQVDAADGLQPVSEVAARKNSKLAVISHDYPGHSWGLDFNTKIAPFDDLKVRQAFLQATDIDAALKSVFFGLYERPGVLSPTTTHFAEQYRSTYTFDLAKAAKLLDEAGWTGRDSDGYRTKNGKRLAVTWTYYTETAGGPDLIRYRSVAEQVQATTKRAGFQVTLNPIASGFPAFLEALQAGSSHIFIQKYTLNSADVLRLLYASPDFIAQYYLDDAELTAAVNEASTTTDPARQATLYTEAQKIYSDKAYGTGLFPESVRVVSSASKAHGIRLEPTLGLLSLHGAWVNP